MPIPSLTVSRSHASLIRRTDGWWLEALTKTNGLAPGEAERLSLGAAIQLGGVVVEVVPAEGTSPVFEPIPTAWLLARLDLDGCSLQAGGHLLDIPPQAAHGLAALIRPARAPRRPRRAARPPTPTSTAA